MAKATPCNMDKRPPTIRELAHEARVAVAGARRKVSLSVTNKSLCSTREHSEEKKDQSKYGKLRKIVSPVTCGVVFLSGEEKGYACSDGSENACVS